MSAIKPRVPYERKFSLVHGTARRSRASLQKSTRIIDHFQSMSARQFGWELDLDLTVKVIEVEPPRIIYDRNGQPQTYFPDFRITYNNGDVEIAEVKSAKRRGDPETMAKYRRIGEVCRERGLKFRLVFSDRILREPKRRNVALLHYYLDWPLLESDLQAATDYFDVNSEASIGDMLTALPDLSRPKILALVGRGYLWLNRFKKFDDNALIRLPRNYEENETKVLAVDALGFGRQS
ncbi:MAG: hypothetical protein E6Q98_08630 [Rhodospirillaceae bacterium]|nr:MAG: hypothetical protein E6Q98_08630 [Rhodospirillaceae bacterium]